MTLIDGKQKHSINIEQNAESVGESALKNSLQITSAEVVNALGPQLDIVKGKQKIHFELVPFWVLEMQVMLSFHFSYFKYCFFPILLRKRCYK